MESYTSECYVAFLDILGFKEMVNSNSHNNLQILYDGFERNVNNSIMPFRSIESNELGQVKCRIVSDSIILWIETDPKYALLNLGAMTTRMLVSGFMMDMPVRGGIAKGPITVKNTDLAFTIFGKGLTDAYSLEAKQNWSGCVIQDGIVEEHLRDFYFKEIIDTQHMFIKYDIPSKDKTKAESWCVNWPLLLIRQPEELIPMFEKHGKKSEAHSVQEKIKHTVKFYKEMSTIYGEFRDYFIKNSVAAESDKVKFTGLLAKLGYALPQYDPGSSYRRTPALDFINQVKERLTQLKTTNPKGFQEVFNIGMDSTISRSESKWLIDILKEVSTA